MAKAWSESEEFEMAVYCYRKALELKPRTEFKRGLAKAYRKAGRYDRSEELLREVLTETPDDADAHYGLALTLFHEQKYREATAEFVWRMNVKDMVQHRKDLHPIFNAPAYNGEDLSNKTLLIHTEQGFGDNLQFARFINLVRPQVKKLVMWCRPGLARLFHHSLDIDEISENVFKLPKFDYQLPLLSIPTHFDPELKSLDNFAPYLSAAPNTQTLTRLNSLNIGLVWGASDSGFDHANKKVPLQLIKPLLDIEGICWHSLQVGSDRQDLLTSALNNQIIDQGERLNDFMATANIIDQLDLVITCDTSVAHLAGAMGKPVWVMLKKIPDWRWLSDGETTPWYPSAQLYRQANHGDWASVIERIKKNLIALIATKRRENQSDTIDDTTMPNISDSSPPSSPVKEEQHQAINYYQLGNAALNGGKLQEALSNYTIALQNNPQNYLALNNLGVTKRRLKLFNEALATFDQALSIKADFFQAISNKGHIYREDLKSPDQAIAWYLKALELQNDNPSAHINLGLAYVDKKDYSLARGCFSSAIQLKNCPLAAYYHRAYLELVTENFQAAVADFNTFLAAQPKHLDALNNRGVALKELGQSQEAAESFEAAIKINPNYSSAYFNYANLLMAKNDYQSAAIYLEKLITVNPGYLAAYINLGSCLKALNKPESAIDWYDKAIAIDPTYSEAHFYKGNRLNALKRYKEAVLAYRTALEKKPNYAAAASNLFLITTQMADWKNWQTDQQRLHTFIDQNISGVSPFNFLDTAENPETSATKQKKCGQLFAQDRVKVDKLPILVKNKLDNNREKLHIGYLSCDFHEHATMHLLEGVFRHHDKSRFTISAYSWTPYDDERTDKVRQFCDRFVCIRTLSDIEAAKQIADDHIDILVDLKGYTRYARAAIQGMRPAPVIVSWLGFPGTMGHERLADYIIGDPIVTPPACAKDFSETLALMPHCYQPNDSEREIGAKISREEAGLPANSFVFCSFTSSHKLNPQTFDIWCQLLKEVPNSVLWLLDPNEIVRENLIKEARLRGIDQQQLVFAPRMPLKEHLGRMQLADLALDTFPYTSHTTGSDALWAGVPLVALQGHTFVSRVSSSLLTAVGLQELITHSWQQYLELARTLALNPEQLLKIRTKLNAKKLSLPLFDTIRFTRNLEKMYLQMWEDKRTGNKNIIAIID